MKTFALCLAFSAAAPVLAATPEGSPAPTTPRSSSAAVAMTDNAPRDTGRSFLGLTEEKLQVYLKARHRLLGFLVKQPSLSGPVKEACRQAHTTRDSVWKPVAKASRLAGPLVSVVPMGWTGFLELHALVTRAYDQYLAAQSLKALEDPGTNQALSRARAILGNTRASADDKAMARMELARVEDARKKFAGLLIADFPASVMALMQRHEQELQAALDESDGDESLTEPSDPTTESEE